MTATEFIEDYSWQRAKEMHEEMLAHGSKRPKEYTFVSENGCRESIEFFGCPYKLKDKRMVNWLRSVKLLAAANGMGNDFTPDERLECGLESIREQFAGSFAIIEPEAFPHCMARFIADAAAFGSGISLMVEMKNALLEWHFDERRTDIFRWQAWSGHLGCATYIIYYSIKTHVHNEYTDWAIDQLLYTLNEDIQVAADNGDEPDLSCEIHPIEALITMIPHIEKSGDKELLDKVYALAATFYQATHRPVLAEKYMAK